MTQHLMAPKLRSSSSGRGLASERRLPVFGERSVRATKFELPGVAKFCLVISLQSLLVVQLSWHYQSQLGGRSQCGHGVFLTGHWEI